MKIVILVLFFVNTSLFALKSDSVVTQNMDSIKEVEIKSDSAKENSDQETFFSEHIKPNLVSTVFASIVALLSAWIVARYTAKATLEKEKIVSKLNFTQQSIKDIITNQSPGDSRRKILFLIESNLISDQNGHIRAALENFRYETESLVSRQKGDVLIDIYMARILILERGEGVKILNEAILNYSNSIDHLNDNFISFKMRGFSYQKLGFEYLQSKDDSFFYFQKSIDDFTLVINRYKDQWKNLASIFYLRGLSYLNIKMYKEAEQDLLKCIEIEETSIDARIYIGIMYFVLEKYDRAIEYSLEGILLAIKYEKPTEKYLTEIAELSKISRTEEKKEWHNKWMVKLKEKLNS